MKFIKKAEESTGEVVALWIQQQSDGSATLVAGSADGGEKSLMVFEDGEYFLCASAFLPGIKTDEAGRILRKVDS